MLSFANCVFVITYRQSLGAYFSRQICFFLFRLKENTQIHFLRFKPSYEEYVVFFKRRERFTVLCRFRRAFSSKSKMGWSLLEGASVNLVAAAEV